MKSTESPLHLAVLHDDRSAVKLLRNNPELMARKNNLGFTAKELALLLHRKEALELLSKDPKRTILVQPKGESAIAKWTVADFERFFQISYLETPIFSSYQMLQKVLANVPWLLQHTIIGYEQRKLGPV